MPEHKHTALISTYTISSICIIEDTKTGHFDSPWSSSIHTQLVCKESFGGENHAAVCICNPVPVYAASAIQDNPTKRIYSLEMSLLWLFWEVFT